MIEFKNDKARETYPKCNDRLQDALFDISKWCDSRKIPCIITRAIDGMIPGVSKTDIHSTGRALDLSVHGWSTDDIDDFCHDFGQKYDKAIGALGVDSGEKRFVVYHNSGAGWHMHLQVGKV